MPACCASATIPPPPLPISQMSLMPVQVAGAVDHDEALRRRHGLVRGAHAVELGDAVLATGDVHRRLLAAAPAARSPLNANGAADIGM